ncbi:MULTISPECIES: class I SAM-dependent DNA methyltransferase [unclassified Mesorhizobium]|uniref:type I restriction-modification system subunit M n=1 Tax=unclassified Mesorhizobium TaxID=325217 RepID=UPI0003CE93F5|nr:MULTISPECIES: class I SAM-dependent DNA methyltransferase [unclassified Mesorhizobium]ESY55396.1 restriction endonuclease subunit M [Mesorhizobium sp. LNJC374B00]ESY56979.1 restriction endonuclease subunit M [Mesorhizobium sp. LNJC372A00]WJI79385.1 N-6 DNA methylase [Mesorhizobium sp. C374B]WJI85921.1 N-6 DNA methylase [Mesorhizobium sp. C372A]
MAKLSLSKLERHLYGAADILRREGMDAATYKDFIFGMLFLKRSSDVFLAARDKLIKSKVNAGMPEADAEANYGENPDYYDEFFVPPVARWPHIQDRLNDASVPFGSVLDQALVGLSQANSTLEHVLDHIHFMRVQGNKRVVSDDACKDLVRHFSRYRLGTEDFQFSDLLGSAYEFLINMFAESAGKKGGDFYTPRDVIRLMVRILNPTPGISIYDPTCGSGGMLIISREYIEQSGGDATNLRLCGQVNDASAWSICKINMLLHGIRGADIQLQDTLLHPMHREAGELERFDRVIANPPFSQNYSRSNMEYPERFRWGWPPTSGKKGDLMFAQHMLATCKDRGMVCTVMPHGVLFRGGAEKEIRTKFLKEDLLEAVISLPQNLFYGAGIPACLLVMRPNRTSRYPNPNKPASRQGKVLFINADAEYFAGRAQNYLLPEHVEKIASTYERFEDIPSYARCVSFDEISDAVNDFNLNIRRYVDNSPQPEPHDVRAHLVGGVPVAEVEANRLLFEALGFEPSRAFTGRAHDSKYYDFGPAVPDRKAMGPLIEWDGGVAARRQALLNAFAAWWAEHSPRLADLPQTRALNAARAELLKSFTTALTPLAMLDRFKLAGVVATWWTETLPDLKTLIENGFRGVIDGWLDAIADAVMDDDNVGPAFDPFSHKLVRHTMADYLHRIDDAKAEIARLKGEKEAFEQSNPPEDADDEELKTWNYAKDLERQIKDLKSENSEAIKVLKKLQKAAAKRGSTDHNRRASASAEAELESVFDQIESVGAELEPYEQIKTDLAAARAIYRNLVAQFVAELRSRCDALSPDEKQALVMELFEQDLHEGLDTATTVKRRLLIRVIENLWDKYARPLTVIQASKEELQKVLAQSLKELGYAT